jgi:uncharacterized protein (DUF4415 family)
MLEKGKYMKKGKSKYVLTGLDFEGVPDEDSPEGTEEWFKNAKHGLDGLAELVGEKNAAPLRKMGRPKSVAPKLNGTLRLSAEVWSGIKKAGRGYNTRVEAVLRDAIAKGIL